LLASAAAFAADDALPKPETIMDRYVEVTGGRAAYEKRTNEVATGSAEIGGQGLKGTLSRYAAAPDKSYTALEFEGVGKFESGSADGVAWEKSNLLGPRVKTGVEKAQALREAVFNHELNWKKLYDKAETAGVETIDGEECYKVILTPPDGKPETTYYQKKSGLIVKLGMVSVNQMGEVPVEELVYDYKPFDGVLMPTRVVQRAAGQEITMTIQTVKVNQNIPASQFDPPADIKALLAKPADGPKK
jgi:zinc protease